MKALRPLALLAILAALVFPLAVSRAAPSASPAVRLDYTQATDLWAGDLSAGTWNTWLSAQSFTVGTSGSVVTLSLRQAGWMRTGDQGHEITAFRFNVDSGAVTEPICASGWSAVAASSSGGDYAELCGGTASVGGLSAGTHTVSVQYLAYFPTDYPNHSQTQAYLRPATYAFEFLRLQVIEFGGG